MFVANFVALVAPVVAIQESHVAADFALPAYSVPNALADERAAGFRRGRSMTSQEGVRRLWCGNWGLRS